MRCPRCQAMPLHAETACPGCGFGLAELRSRLAPLPARAGRLCDQTGLLALNERDLVTARLDALAAATDGEVVVAVLPEARGATPAELAFALFDAWRVGGPDGSGALFLVTLRPRRYELLLGRGWRERLDLTAAAEICAERVRPLLSDDWLPTALWAAIDSLRRLLGLPELPR